MPSDKPAEAVNLLTELEVQTDATADSATVAAPEASNETITPPPPPCGNGR